MGSLGGAGEERSRRKEEDRRLIRMKKDGGKWMVSQKIKRKEKKNVPDLFRAAGDSQAEENKSQRSVNNL